MKKLINQIKTKVTFFYLLLGTIIIGLIVLFASVSINYIYTKNMTTVFEQNQTKIEHILQNINSQNNNKNKIVYTTIELPKEDFLRQYYLVQADWLNKWLAVLAVIMAILGVVLPLCFEKFLENKEKEMDRIIQDAKKQKDDMQLQVNDVSKKYEYVKNATEQALKQYQDMQNDLIKAKQYAADAAEKAEQVAKDQEKVKQYVFEAQALSKYNESLNKIRENKYDDAIQLLHEAIELDKSQSKFFYALGCMYEQVNQNKKAIEYIKEALKIEDDIKYYHALGSAYLALREFEKLFELENIVKPKLNTRKDFSKWNSIMAAAYSYQKDVSITKELIKKVIDTHIVTSFIYCNLSSAYLCIGEYYNAIELIEHNNQINIHDKIYYNLLEAYIYIKEYSKALDVLNEAINSKCEDFDYIYEDDMENWMKELDNPEQTDVVITLKNSLKKIKIEPRM